MAIANRGENLGGGVRGGSSRSMGNRARANSRAASVASARRDSAVLGESLGADKKSIKRVQKSISKRGTGIGPINNTQKSTIKALKAANKKK